MKNIIFGMPSLIEYSSIEENIALCKELGLSFIELNMNLPAFSPGNMDMSKFQKLKNKNDIFFTLHINEKMDIAIFDENIRKACLKTIGETIEMAKDLEVPIINLHLSEGIYFKLPTEKKYLYDQYFERYMENIKLFSAYVEEMVGDSNITICIENTGINNHDFIKKATDELLKKDLFKLTWDIGHDHSSGFLDLEYINENRDKVKHFHIHDAIGDKNHLELNTGEIEFEDKYQLAQENNCLCVVEVKTVSSLTRSVRKL